MGNYEIQAKIDIERHPEWTEEEQNEHLYRMKIKDTMSDKFSYRKRRSELFELIEEYLDKALLLSWENFADIKKPWARGLRANTRIIDEGAWTNDRY